MICIITNEILSILYKDLFKSKPNLKLVSLLILLVVIVFAFDIGHIKSLFEAFIWRHVLVLIASNLMTIICIWWILVNNTLEARLFSSYFNRCLVVWMLSFAFLVRIWHQLPKCIWSTINIGNNHICKI